jgi:DNA-binding MarR family transcriptional regulator
MARTANSINQPPGGLDQLNALLQHRARLGTMVLLSANAEINFSTLRALLKETDGNLGAQLRKLEEADYIAVKKEFQDRKPVSWYSLTAAGRRALKNHLAALETVVRSAGV